MKKQMLHMFGVLVLILFAPIICVHSYAGSISSNNSVEITTQPHDFTYVANTIPEVRVEATGDGLSYQWQYKYASQQNWTDWNNATNATLGKYFTAS